MTGRDPLARVQPTPIDAEAIKRAAWREDGILVVAVDRATGLGWLDREFLRTIGDRLYGPRPDRKAR